MCTFGGISRGTMFKRPENVTTNDYFVPAKRAKFDAHQRNPRDSKTREKETHRDKNAQYDDLWGDDFAEEDIEEMDLVASQACLQVLYSKGYSV